MLELLDFGKNTAFILISYGASFAILGFLIGFSVHRRKKAAKKLAEIEKQFS